MSLAPSKWACVFCGLMQRNTQTKSTTTANDQCLHIEVEAIVLERHAFSGQAECDFFAKREVATLGVVWRLRLNWNIPQNVEEVWIHRFYT